MLHESLENASNIQSYGRGVDRELIEKIQSSNSAIYNNIISDAFDGRNVSCHISYSTFWVYSDSLDDVENVKSIANYHGYKNMRTFRPWTTDENDCRIDDPKGKFAVDIWHSTELVIGNAAKQFVKFIKPITDKFEENLMYTYGHMGNISLKVNDENKAIELKDSLVTFFGLKDELTPQIDIKFDVSIKNESIDCWNIHIQVKRQQ